MLPCLLSNLPADRSWFESLSHLAYHHEYEVRRSSANISHLHPYKVENRFFLFVLDDIGERGFARRFTAARSYALTSTLSVALMPFRRDHDEHDLTIHYGDS